MPAKREKTPVAFAIGSPAHEERRRAAKDEMPTDEEAEASAQADLYEIVCLSLERMSDETRRKTFALIKRKYQP